MLLQVVGPEGAVEFDMADGWREGAPPVPCHRCGVCCERWQPLLSHADSSRLAVHLDLTPASFTERYTSAYPFDDEVRLLDQTDGHCVFLRYEGGRSACAVHDVRPEICREWTAGLDKKECVQGLARFADGASLVQLGDLYPDREEAAAFMRAAWEEIHAGA